MKINMKIQMLALLGTLCLCAGVGSALAQDGNAVIVVRQPGSPDDGGPGGGPPGGFGGNFRGGNFDPQQFQQMMMDNTRHSLNITNDEEWKAIEPLVQSVMDARRDAGGFGGGGMRMMFGGPGGPGGGGNGGNQSGNTQRQMRFGPQSPEQEALQKSLDDNAPAAQVKEAMAKFRAAKKEKQAKLEAAQEKLRSVLTTKQEGQAMLMGLLP